MKTAKKVLSIVLAAMLILGTIPFAAFAYDLADGQSVALTLKAEVLDGEGAAEVKAYGGEAAYNSTKPTTAQKAGQKKDFAAYKALDEHDYADKTKTITVNPGQVVWVTFGIKTTGEIYPTFWASSISYTSLFYSLTNTTGCLVTNADGEYVGTMEGSATANYWGLMTATARTKFKNGNDHSYAINFDVSYSADGVADLDEDIYAVPFYVDPDATAGTTGSIYIPVSTDKVATTVSGFEEGDYSGDPYEITDLDLTGAVLNFVVGGDVELDYTALDTQIAAFEGLTEADYTAESWAVAEEAYNDAVAAKTDATTQEEVDAAATALEEAITALVEAGPVLDYTAINNALAAVPADTSDYTTTSVAALAQAKAAADTAKASATTQAELDTAAANLTTAINGLVLKADMTALNAALDDAAAADTTYWNAASKTALSDAVAAGQAIVAQADDYSDTAAVAAAAQAINDALANYVLAGADYSVVDQYVAEAATKTEADYTAATWATLETALNGVVRGKNASQQADVDAMAAAIRSAIDGLKEKADTTALAAAVAAAGNAAEEDYAADTWTTIQNLVNYANTFINGDCAKDDAQATIDQTTEDLNAALANKLGAADYTAVDNAIAAVPADLTPYTAETVAAVNAAVNAVVRGYKADKQAEVDAMAEAINNAVADLAVRKADLTALNAAIAATSSVDTADKYTEASYTAYTEAKAAAEALVAEAPDYTKQDDVDAAAEALNDAVAGLTYLGADFTAIDALVAQANALVRTNYTDASLAAFDAAFADTLAMYNNKADYDITDQAAIDAQATTGATAFDALVLKDADFTEIDNLVANANALIRDNYTAASLEAFDAAIASTLNVYNNKANYNITNQAEIDEIAGEGEQAFFLLVLDAADYTETNKYLNQIAALNADDYTTASWEALQAVIAATPMDLTKDKQSEVDDNAYKLRKAKNALVKAADGDYTAVNAAIDEFNALDKTIYTDESVAAVDEAIAAVVTGLNENHQAEIDAMATAINEAIAALVEKTYDAADYTAVDAAKARFNALDASLYTAESVKAVTDAIAAVKEGLDEREQDTVDGYAAAINAAIDDLELLPEPEGKTVEATYTETAELTKTYSFKVEGRAWKIQIVDMANNKNTVTFSRTDTPEIITSYNADGEEVDDMSRDLSYEIWTVTLPLKDGQYTVIARDAVAGWETLDLGYAFNVVSSTKNATAESIVASAESAKVGEQLPVTVTTGKDVLKIQLLVNGKEYMVFNKTAATADGDNLVFNAYVKLFTKGTNTITVKIKTASGWTTTDLSTEVECVK